MVSFAVLTTMVLPLPPAATLFVGGRPLLLSVRMFGDDSNGVSVIDWGDPDDSLDAATLTILFFRFARMKMIWSLFATKFTVRKLDGTILGIGTAHSAHTHRFFFFRLKWNTLLAFLFPSLSLCRERRQIRLIFFFFFPVCGSVPIFFFPLRIYLLLFSHDKPANR